MKISEMKEVLRACIEADIPAFVWGERGIGKSDSVFQLSEEMDMEFRDLRLATQEVSDLIGMPSRGDDQTRWLKPEWFPAEGTRGILFLDEANRAPRDVIQAVFQLVRDRRMHTHVLPAGWRIVSAGNYESAGYDVRRLDEAFLSRFLHINAEVSVDDLCTWGTANGWSDKTVNFLQANTKMVVENCDNTSFYEPKPDPRRWDMVDRLVATGLLTGAKLQAALTGLVGSGAAAAYKSFVGSSIHMKDVLSGKMKFEREPEEDGKKGAVKIISPKVEERDLRKLATECAPFLKEQNYTEKKAQNLSMFIQALPKDLGTMVAKSILSQLTTSDWAKFLRKDKEILEYFEFLFGEKS